MRSGWHLYSWGTWVRTSHNVGLHRTAGFADAGEPFGMFCSHLWPGTQLGRSASAMLGKW
jgi:hypothetical protein